MRALPKSHHCTWSTSSGHLIPPVAGPLAHDGIPRILLSSHFDQETIDCREEATPNCKVPYSVWCSGFDCWQAPGETIGHSSRRVPETFDCLENGSADRSHRESSAAVIYDPPRTARLKKIHLQIVIALLIYFRLFSSRFVVYLHCVILCLCESLRRNLIRLRTEILPGFSRVLLHSQICEFEWVTWFGVVKG